MKKSLLLIIVLLILSLVGCGTSNTISTLEDWSFQYNSGTDDYSLFFALCNERGQNISAEVDVDIRIVNWADEIVFEDTKNVNVDDFNYYSSQVSDERFLANVRIPSSEIDKGQAANGIVYFTIFQNEYAIFDECNVAVLMDLPIKDFDIRAEELPVEVNSLSYDSSVSSTFRIENMHFETDGFLASSVIVTIEGIKTYEKDYMGYDLSMDVLNYKLYDSENFMVDSGSVFLNDLAKDDKFREDIVFYELIPGETYTIKFEDYK